MSVRKPAHKTTRKRVKKTEEVPLHPTDWRTTDQEEILRRNRRAREEKHAVKNLNPQEPIFSCFEVKSPSGMTYQVEIRDVFHRFFSCTCPDFRTAGLGTCKHVEATLIFLKRREKVPYRLAEKSPSPHAYLIPSPSGDTLCVEQNLSTLSRLLQSHFEADGILIGKAEDLLSRLRRHSKLRVSQDVAPFLENRERAVERIRLRREYEAGVVSGRHPEHVTLQPLYPYQREGMLHLAFGERSLLADEMGLGKTIQAIAACALLHHLGKAQRVLVVAPASLKSEWEEQIKKFTTLSQQIVFGTRNARIHYYADPNPPFFTLTNYEQIIPDALDINHHLRPDIVILDEAQRIKNWATKTAQAVKRLESRYAFVLTGTPIENRIDEIYSIANFLDPTLLGPLFRFNREYYSFDEKGRPAEYRNLEKLRQRISPLLLRRRKYQVETELPERTDHNHFVKLTTAMRADYDDYKKLVGDIVTRAKSRPLTKKESDLMMILLSIMRMICDSPSIVKDLECKDCPKMTEIASILEEVLEEPDVKVIIFSEWTGMLERVRDWAIENGIGYAWHTGSVPQKKRRAEIMAFRQDPSCRLFFSTDSGGVGLNLQNASVVINCDLPWNPAKLEQRIARAWRKNQTRAVTVINLIAENTIEHQMLTTLALKSNLSQGVLDGSEEALSLTRLKRGREATLERLEQFLMPIHKSGKRTERSLPPADPTLHFADRLSQSLGEALIHCQEALLPDNTTPVLLAVLRDKSRSPAVQSLFHDTQWRGDPPQLHVLDEATWASLQQLAQQGLLSFNTRATRHLGGGEVPPPARPALSEEQLRRIADLRAFAAKKEKVAKVLLDADLADEAAPHKEAAEKALAEAEAIECGESVNGE